MAQSCGKVVLRLAERKAGYTHLDTHSLRQAVETVTAHQQASRGLEGVVSWFSLSSQHAHLGCKAVFPFPIPGSLGFQTAPVKMDWVTDTLNYLVMKPQGNHGNWCQNLGNTLSLSCNSWMLGPFLNLLLSSSALPGGNTAWPAITYIPVATQSWLTGRTQSGVCPCQLCTSPAKHFIDSLNSWCLICETLDGIIVLFLKTHLTPSSSVRWNY